MWERLYCWGYISNKNWLFNPYLLHFGNIQERHFWKKNPKIIFLSLMTSYMSDYLWRHINLKVLQLDHLYINWPKSRDVISRRYHVITKITSKKPGTELASFLEKKSRRFWESLGASFLEKIPKNGIFALEKWVYKINEFWELSQRHFWKKNPDTFLYYLN